jgi:hypothetical protein
MLACHGKNQFHEEISHLTSPIKHNFAGWYSDLYSIIHQPPVPSISTGTKQTCNFNPQDDVGFDSFGHIVPFAWKTVVMGNIPSFLSRLTTQSFLCRIKVTTPSLTVPPHTPFSSNGTFPQQNIGQQNLSMSFPAHRRYENKINNHALLHKKW